MGIFAPGYAMHQYRRVAARPPWPTSSTTTSSISSAGLLRAGRSPGSRSRCPSRSPPPRAWCSGPTCWPPPRFDGSIATTFKRTVTDVVCDNTREAALAEQGQTYKVKHSRHSHAQLAPAREALAMVHTLADDFAARGRRAVRHHRHRPAVGQVPRRPRQPGRQGRHPAEGPGAHPGRQEARHPPAALPPRPAGRTLGRHRARGDPGGQHLRAPREHRPRRPPGRAEHAPHRSPATSASSTAPP